MKNMLGRKLHLGWFAVPMWTVGLAGLLVAAAAGQAVGPVLSGSVQGSAGLVVSQTVVLDSTTTGDTVTGADDFAITYNDEGTAFTVAIETQVGQSQMIKLVLENKSGKTANAILELNAPCCIDVDADDDSDDVNTTADDDVTAMAQLNRNTYLLTLQANDGTDDTPDLFITVESKDDAAPGFYTITGRIIQVAN